jgi:hypothetical protein
LFGYDPIPVSQRCDRFLALQDVNLNVTAEILLACFDRIRPVIRVPMPKGGVSG